MPGPDIERAWIQRCMVDNVLREMSDSEIRSYLVYGRDADPDGMSSPGNPDVAEKTGLSIRSVQRAVTVLVSKHGLLARASKGTGGRGVFTRYKVVELEDADGSKLCWIPGWIIDRMLRAMSDSEIRVFLVYTRHANADGDSYPGNPLISYKSGLCIRSIQRAVRGLLQKGLMSKVSKGTGGRRVFTVYRMLSQSWIEYQRATGQEPDPPEEPISGDSEDVSEPQLSTNPATGVMVCGENGANEVSGAAIPRQIGDRVCGKLSTKHDRAVADTESHNEKACQPCRNTMTSDVLKHDRAMSPEVSGKQVSKTRAGKGDGKRQRPTAGIEDLVKTLFKPACNARTTADKLVKDLYRHLAKQTEQTACATAAVT